MHVPVVKVLAVLVVVGDGIMTVRMAVRADRHPVVAVVVMAVVVAVHVLVLQRLVGVAVAVPFRDVQRDPDHHQRGGQREGPAWPG
jgi:hypothetical protein